MSRVSLKSVKGILDRVRYWKKGFCIVMRYFAWDELDRSRKSYFAFTLVMSRYRSIVRKFPQSFTKNDSYIGANIIFLMVLTMLLTIVQYGRESDVETRSTSITFRLEQENIIVKRRNRNRGHWQIARHQVFHYEACIFEKTLNKVWQNYWSERTYSMSMAQRDR